MLLPTLYILANGCIPPELIKVKTFTLATTEGDNVFQEQFDRRRLADTLERLALKFDAVDKHFEFEFRRNSVFAPDAIIRKTGRVRTNSDNQFTPLCMPLHTNHSCMSEIMSLRYRAKI